MEFDWLSFLGGLLAGLILGWSSHRFALDRDKRKEFNVVASELLAILDAEEQALSPRGGGINRNQIQNLIRRCGFWRGRAIASAFASYERTKDENREERRGESFGDESVYRTPEDVKRVIHSLKRHLRLR